MAHENQARGFNLAPTNPESAPVRVKQELLKLAMKMGEGLDVSRKVKFGAWDESWTFLKHNYGVGWDTDEVVRSVLIGGRKHYHPDTWIFIPEQRDLLELDEGTLRVLPELNWVWLCDADLRLEGNPFKYTPEVTFVKYTSLVCDIEEEIRRLYPIADRLEMLDLKSLRQRDQPDFTLELTQELMAPFTNLRYFAVSQCNLTHVDEEVKETLHLKPWPETDRQEKPTGFLGFNTFS